MSGKNKHRSANDYLQYLKGEISSQERHAFEKGLEADPFEQEAMEGLESLETGQAEQDILYLHNRLRKRLSRRRRVAFYSVAATVASLLIVGTVFLKIHDFNPSSDEKQVYPEEAFDSGTPPEALTITPAQQETEAEEPVSPTQERGQESTEKTPVKEIEPIKIVDQKEAELEKVETYDFALAEEEKAEVEVSMMAAPAPITHMEAEPKARDTEDRVTQSARNSGKRKKSMAQPVAQSPQEISMLTGKVSGIVISAEDQGPISGAIVENRELNSGVFTDLDGRFDIAVQEDTPNTLVASFIGMETQEYSVTGETDIELILEPDPITLEEVVVVGHVSHRASSPVSSTQVVRYDDQEGAADYLIAEPSVGYKEYKKYIEEHIQFPVDDTVTEKAVVVLKFNITRSGEISDVTALRSPGELFSAEAIRLLMEGPAWNPASTDKGTKDEQVRMRIVFKR